MTGLHDLVVPGHHTGRDRWPAPPCDTWPVAPKRRCEGSKMLLRQHTAVSAFVAPSLHPGERIQAILSFAETGSSAWRNLWFVASLGRIAAKSEPRACAVVVTDRRLLVVGQ